MRIIIQLSLLTLLLSSCAGYKFKRKTNPFLSQGIRSIAIPTFVNKTSLPVVAQAYTNAVHDVLSSYPDLKVNSGDIDNEDAIVLGIITNKHGKKLEYTSSTLMTEEQITEIGDRNAFYLPTAAEYSLYVQLIILKKPTREEIDFFVNYFKFSKSAFPRTIFSKTFEVGGSFSINNEIGNIDSEAPLRGTRTRGNMIKSLTDSSVNLSSELREVLSNVY